MPNFNAVAHLVRPAERAHTDRHTDSLKGNNEMPLATPTPPKNLFSSKNPENNFFITMWGIGMLSLCGL